MLTKFYTIACEGPVLRDEIRTPARGCLRGSGHMAATAEVARKTAIRKGWQRVELQVTEYSRRRVDLCPVCARIIAGRETPEANRPPTSGVSVDAESTGSNDTEREEDHAQTTHGPSRGPLAGRMHQRRRRSSGSS